MKFSRLVIIGAGAALVGTPAVANDLSEVEGARAAERSGQYVSDQDVELLDRHGGNDDQNRYYRDSDEVVVYAPYPHPAGYVEYDTDYDD